MNHDERIVLVPGVGLRIRGCLAYPEFETNAARDAYASIVGKEQSVPRSAYYMEWWKGTLGPFWHSLRDTLLQLATDSEKRDPRPTLPALERAIGMSQQTIRREIDFWGRPYLGKQGGGRQYVDALPREQWRTRPVRNAIERWIGVRSYIPVLRRSHENQPWTFVVLVGDRPHPQQDARWAHLLSYEQPRLYFDPPLCPSTLSLHSGGSAIRPIDACPSTLSFHFGGSENQTTPYNSSVMDMVMDMPMTDSGTEAACYKTTVRAAARQKLREYGIRGATIRELLTHEKGPEVCLQWLEWAPYCETRWRKTAHVRGEADIEDAIRGIFVVAIREVLSGKVPLEEPDDVIADRKKREDVEKRARIAAERVQREAEQRARTAPPPPEIPIEIVQYWECVLAYARRDPMRFAYWADVRPLGIRGKIMLFHAPNATIRTYLNKNFRETIMALLIEHFPDVIDAVEFTTETGASQ